MHKVFGGKFQHGEKQTADKFLSLSKATQYMVYEDTKGVLFTDGTFESFNWMGTKQNSIEAFGKYKEQLKTAALYTKLETEAVARDDKIFELINKIKWDEPRPQKYLHIKGTRHLFHDTINSRKPIRFMKDKTGHHAMFRAKLPKTDGQYAYKVFVDVKQHPGATFKVENVTGLPGAARDVVWSHGEGGINVVLDFGDQKWKNYSNSPFVIEREKKGGFYTLTERKRTTRKPKTNPNANATNPAGATQQDESGKKPSKSKGQQKRGNPRSRTAPPSAEPPPAVAPLPVPQGAGAPRDVLYKRMLKMMAGK